MSKSAFQPSSDAADRSKQRSYSHDFRPDVVRLITDEGCYIPAAAKVCGTNDQTIRNWHGRFASVPVSAGDDATVEELPASEVARYSVHVR